MTKRISKIAKIYSDSLLNSAMEYETIKSNFNIVFDVIKNSDDYKLLIDDPTVSSDKKFDVTVEIFKNELDNTFLNFLKVLIKKGRFGYLSEIYESYLNDYNKINDVQCVDIVSALELSESFKTKILDKLNLRLNKNINPNWIVDESLIGGLVIKIGDDIIDSSVKMKLEKFSKI